VQQGIGFNKERGDSVRWSTRRSAWKPMPAGRSRADLAAALGAGPAARRARRRRAGLVALVIVFG
jgi:hypothetical protein